MRKMRSSLLRPRVVRGGGVLLVLALTAAWVWSQLPESTDSPTDEVPKTPTRPDTQFPVLRPRHKQTTPSDLSTPPPLLEADVIPADVRRVFIRDLNRTLLGRNSSSHVILSVVDYGFLDMTVNFIRLSVEKLHLEFVAVCTDPESQAALRTLGYPCVLLDLQQAGGRQASDFGSAEYYRKTNLKTWVVLQCLQLGSPVLLSDVDVVYFHDPFPSFTTCPTCDAYVQMDRELYNSGFVYVRPTPGGLSLYRHAWDLYLQYHKGHDQAYINIAITLLTKNSSLQVQRLPWRQFPCGLYYFEHDYRRFYNKPTCESCVIAHNNYMGTTAAKVYRFKENLLWTVDRDGYYSDPTTRYLTYENPLDFGDRTHYYETEALLSGLLLAHLTNRVLILPSFRCCNCRTSTCDHPVNRCSLLSVLKVREFDEMFGGRYREHSFLANPAVPVQTRTSASPVLRTHQSVGSDLPDVSRYIYTESTAEFLDLGVNLTSIGDLKSALERFSAYSVIRLDSLYKVKVTSDVISSDGHPLADYFRGAIQCGLYEQWNDSVEKALLGKLT